MYFCTRDSFRTEERESSTISRVGCKTVNTRIQCTMSRPTQHNQDLTVELQQNVQHPSSEMMLTTIPSSVECHPTVHDHYQRVTKRYNATNVTRDQSRFRRALHTASPCDPDSSYSNALFAFTDLSLLQHPLRLQTRQVAVGPTFPRRCSSGVLPAPLGRTIITNFLM